METHKFKQRIRHLLLLRQGLSLFIPSRAEQPHGNKIKAIGGGDIAQECLCTPFLFARRQKGITMRATRKYDELRLTDKMALSATDLMQMLSCGRATAEKIGEAAGARIKVGRRVLYNAERIRNYLERVAG